MTILVGYDCGHSYNTAGKRTPEGEREWTFNNAVGKAFEAEIKNYEGVLTKRYDDPTGKTDVPLATRTNNANKDKCDYFISFHHNANTGKWGNWTGTEIHVYEKVTKTSKAYKLANALDDVVANAYGLKNRGIKFSNLHITRETEMPAILIEGGFMDSLIDIEKLRNSATLKNVGVKVAQAVAKHLGLKEKSVTTTTTTTTTTGVKYHTVIKGDTLYAISKKYGTTVEKIMELNNLKNTTLSIGQKLQVSGTVATYHTVVKGDTLYAIAKKYGTTVAKLKALNPNIDASALKIGSKIVVKE